MIVTCPDCDTSFQLDESRIPQKGIRVRCSRCKHAFHLAKPSVSEGEAIDAVAAEAAADGVSTPSITQDLDGPVVADAAAAGGAEINNEDAAEWEFNEDVPATNEDAGTPGEGDGLFGTMDRDAPSGLDLDSDDAAAADVAAEPAVDAAPSALEAEPAQPVVADTPTTSTEEPMIETDAEASSGLDLGGDTADISSSPAAEDGADAPSGLVMDTEAAETSAADEDDGAGAFGSVDDFSSLMDDDPLDAIAAPQADHTADEFRAQASEAQGAAPDTGASEELGDPENWDFFDGASPPPDPVAPASQALGRVAIVPAGTLADEMAAGGGRAAGPIADPSKRGRLAEVLESAGRSVGWALVIVGFALGLVSGLWTTAESFVAGERTTAVGPIEAVDMRASWLDTARAGRVLLVTGGLRNPTQTAATIPGPLEIELLDRLGTPLDLPPVAAGVELSERQLRELPAAVLTRVRAQAAQELQSTAIPAGGLLPFQVILFDAPATGVRFEARVASNGTLSLPEPAVETPHAEDDMAVEQGDAEAMVPSGAEAADALALEAGTLDAAGTERVDEAASGEAAAPAPASAAPGYEDPYGEDSGIGLQDL